jgi:uncharacterized protein YcbK (DUF882 family)
MNENRWFLGRGENPMFGRRDVRERPLNRRRMLELSAGAAISGLLIPNIAEAAKTDHRAIALDNLHTGEKLSVVYWSDGSYLPDALSEINKLLRDFRTGELTTMDARLVDLLYLVRRAMGSQAPFEIISGYRSPRTNAMLARASSGVAKRSLHTLGMAADVRLPGRDLTELRRIGHKLRLGGVGYYSKSNFVHLDVGRVRYW